MIDALGQVAGVQAIPMRGFVGVNRGAGGDAAFQHRKRLSFTFEDVGKRAAVAFAHDDDDAALAGLVDRKATVAAVFFVIGGLGIAAKIGAVDFDRTGSLHGFDFRRHGLADFVGHDVGGLVLHVEIAGKRQGGLALDLVDEDRDGEKVGRNRELAAGEDRA